MEATRGNIEQAFDRLLEQVDLEIVHVNRTGAAAFEAGHYAQVDQARQRVTELREFKDKILTLRQEWERPTAPQRSRDEINIVADRHKSGAPRRELGRARTGLRTHEQAYYRPILEALVQLGGSGEMNNVLDRVERVLKTILTPVDYEGLPSHPETPRWRNSAQWARNSMVRNGLLKPVARRGIWEITQKGRNAIATLPSPETSSSSMLSPEPIITTDEANLLPAANKTGETDVLREPATSAQQLAPQAQLTPLEAYYRLILRALDYFGGAARLADVRAQVESRMKDHFTGADLSRHPDNPQVPLWLTLYYQAAGDLFHQGMIMNGTKDDSWQITDKGHELLAQEDNS